MRACKCGCGEMATKVFLNQEHHLAWMYAGGARQLAKLQPVEAKVKGGRTAGERAASSGRLREAGLRGAERAREIAEEYRRKIEQPSSAQDGDAERGGVTNGDLSVWMRRSGPRAPRPRGQRASACVDGGRWGGRARRDQRETGGRIWTAPRSGLEGSGARTGDSGRVPGEEQERRASRRRGGHPGC